MHSGRAGTTETIDEGGGRLVRAAAGASGKKPLPIPKDLPWRYAKRGELGPGELGSTSKTGDIIIRRGLDPRLESEVIRHEAGHRFLTPLGEGPVTAFRQDAMEWMYQRSVVMRVLEEGAVETYGTRSLLRGVSLTFGGGYSLAPGWGDLIVVGGAGGTVYVVAKASEWTRWCERHSASCRRCSASFARPCLGSVPSSSFVSSVRGGASHGESQ